MKKHTRPELMNMSKEELVCEVRAAQIRLENTERVLDRTKKVMKDWAPVLHGKWRYSAVYTFLGIDSTGMAKHEKKVVYFCSCCGKYVLTPTAFCPYCPAIMDGGTENET